MAWQLNVTLLYKQGASQPVVRQDGRISPIFTPQSWTEHRRTFGPNPCCKVHSSMEHSDLNKTSEKPSWSHGENSTWKFHMKKVNFFGSAFFGCVQWNLQDANSNRLAWKCPSPGDKPRYQVANTGQLFVANDVEEEFQGYNAGQMIKFEVSSSSFQLCPLVSSWCNQSPSWMHCDSAAQPLNIHLSHLSVWRKSKQKTSQRFSVALLHRKKRKLTELLTDHPPCHGEFDDVKKLSRKENQWHFWNWTNGTSNNLCLELKTRPYWSPSCSHMLLCTSKYLILSFYPLL